MDDLELEARLRTHLHRRLDDAPIPVGLASNVSQSLATAASPVGLATRTGRLRLGWAAVAVAIVLVAVIGIGRGLAPTGPGAVATPTPSAVPAAPERLFIVLPANGTLVGKSESTLAESVLSTRLRALGVGNFTSSGDNVLYFSLPVGGPSDASIRAVLEATGDLRIVPLPAADYGAGMRVATLGAPLPKDEPALFGWDGITSIASGSFTTADGTTGAPLLGMMLKAPAAQAFTDFVDAHAGETYAIVVDGKVALLPTAQPAAADGSFSLSNGRPPSGSQPIEAYDETVAVLVGGILPEAWRGATSPVLITQGTAEATALAATNGGTVHSASLGAGLTYSLSRGDYWQIAWRIEVVQPDCLDVSACVSPGWSTLVEVDAVTGDVFHVGALEP